MNQALVNQWQKWSSCVQTAPARASAISTCCEINSSWRNGIREPNRVAIPSRNGRETVPQLGVQKGVRAETFTA